jgi:hypothetical protein
MIYEVSSPGYRTIFEEHDVGNPHKFSVTRLSDNGYRITRYNTIDEIQLAGLARLLGGSAHERLPSDHHVFIFDRVNDQEVRIACETSGRPNDDYTLWWSEVEAQLSGYAKCIWDEKVEYSQAASALRNNRDQIIVVLGEKPPFMQKVEGPVAAARYNDTFMYEILPSLALAILVSIGICVFCTIASIAVTAITSATASPKLLENALSPSRPTRGLPKSENTAVRPHYTHDEALRILGWQKRVIQ